MAKKFRITKKQVVTVIAVVALIGAAVGFGFLVRQLQQTGANNDGSQQSSDAATNEKLPSLISEVQDLQTSGKTDEAIKKIDEGIANTSTDNDTKYMLYIQKGNTRANAGDWRGSIDEYLKALAVNETFEVTQLLGGSYQEVGDNAKAIEYYKKAAKLAPTDGPMQNREREVIEDTIRYLGGTP